MLEEYRTETTWPADTWCV